MSDFWNNRGLASNAGEEPVPAQFLNQSSAAPTPPQSPNYEELEALVQTEEDEDYYNSLVLSDARLRLVQGSLYEKIMDHNLFDGYDADPIAIKNVEREIKKYARERMEVMLGMRQERVQQTTQGQFTDQEVAILKALISRGTSGSSTSTELNKVVSSAPQKLNTIASPPSHKIPPVKSPNPAPKPTPIQQRQATPPPQVQIPVQDQEMPTKSLHEMNEQEREAHLERNRQKYARKTAPVGGLPMPSGASEQMGYQAMVSSSSGLGNAERSLMSNIINSVK